MPEKRPRPDTGVRGLRPTRRLEVLVPSTGNHLQLPRRPGHHEVQGGREEAAISDIPKKMTNGKKTGIVAKRTGGTKTPEILQPRQRLTPRPGPRNATRSAVETLSNAAAAQPLMKRRVRQPSASATKTFWKRTGVNDEPGTRKSRKQKKNAANVAKKN